MVKADIPPEIWGCIFYFLAKPIPPPRSNPPRSDLRQGHLTVAARVCKLFNSISNTLLYSHILTDNLPGLFSDVQRRSKRRLLANTRSLRIEYCAKGQDFTYYELLNEPDETYKSLWWRCGIKAQDKDEAVFAQCEDEVDRLTRCMTELCQLGIKAVLPNLQTIAVGSIYHHQHGLWMRHRTKYPKPKPDGSTSTLYHATTLFAEFLAGGNSVKHFCFRDPGSPFSLIPIPTGKDQKPPSYLPTVHFNVREKYIPLCPYAKTRWISDAHSSTSWADLIHGVASAASGPMSIPRSLFAGTFDLEVFCSTSRYGPISRAIAFVAEFGLGLVGQHLRPATVQGPPLSPEEQESMAAELGDRLQRRFRKDRRSRDSITWLPSAACPRCPACGSLPPA